MIEREEMQKKVKCYKKKEIKMGELGSHSALNVAGWRTSRKVRRIPVYVFCQQRRDLVYSRYYNQAEWIEGKIQRKELWKIFERILWGYHLGKGVIDKTIVLENFLNILDAEIQEMMEKENVIWIPNRSFWCYCGEKRIQNEFMVPIFGSRNMLHLEDREKEEFNYYDILKAAGIRMPEKIDDPKDIDKAKLVMVKIPHKVYRLERGFFTVTSYDQYSKTIENLLSQNIIAEDDLPTARIERFAIGPVCNFNFFYSPVSEALNIKGLRALEPLSVEQRLESDLDGFVRLPADIQIELTSQGFYSHFIVVGHQPMTLRESLIQPFFEIAERFVETSKKLFSPGIIGPFGLQCIIEKDRRPTVYDVAFRIPGGDNIYAFNGHPYANIFWGEEMPTGKRIAFEIQRAIDNDLLDKIVT